MRIVLSSELVATILHATSAPILRIVDVCSSAFIRSTGSGDGRDSSCASLWKAELKKKRTKNTTSRRCRISALPSEDRMLTKMRPGRNTFVAEFKIARPRGGRQKFFASISFSVALSITCSARRFLSLRFSSSSAFRRLRNLQPALLRFPGIEFGCETPCRRHTFAVDNPCLLLLRNRDDLLIAEPALTHDVRLLIVGRTLNRNEYPSGVRVSRGATLAADPGSA